MEDETRLTIDNELKFQESLVETYIARVKHRLHVLNKNWLAVICGETGSSKSYTALRIGEMIGPVYFVFTPMEFMQLINNKKIKRGSCIIFDEAGVGLSAREWQSMQNKLLGAVLQTFRNMNIAVIFTTPNLSFIDVQARKLFHAFLETDHIDRKENIAYVKPYDIQVNVRMDKTYYRFPIFESDKGVTVNMGLIGFGKPSEKLLRKYEKASAAYKKKVREDTLKALTEEKDKPEKAITNDNNLIKAKAEEILKNKDYKDYTGVSGRLKIRMEYDVGEQTAKSIQQYLNAYSKDKTI